MDTIILILHFISLAGICSIFLFRKYLFSYSSEKGKNLATKEDMAEITQKVEEVKSNYVEELERLKVELSLLSKKHSILLDEKIRVFKKLQKRLVDFKKYCEASLGTHGDRGELHSNLNVLDEQIDPCLADVFISAVKFMEGEPPQKWWYYTEERKRTLSKERR